MRIDDLTGPPGVGQRYLVPCVHAIWCGKADWWPVLLPLHSDADHFAFEPRHYHVDTRFLAPARAPRDGAAEPQGALQWPLAEVLGPWNAPEPNPFSKAEWRWRKCQHTKTLDSCEQWLRRHETVTKFRAAMAGRTCPVQNGRRLCPHRAADLTTVPVVDGMVVCPLHGLRIDATTWRVEAVADEDGGRP